MGPNGRRILGEREVGACVVVVGEVAGKNAAQVAFGEESRHSRRTEPIRRSPKGFCHGLWTAVTTSRMPMFFTRCWKESP
jgi:hypothetical protein